MNPDIRGIAETQVDYRARRRRNRLRMEQWLRGRLFWDSKVNGPIVRVDEQTYAKKGA